MKKLSLVVALALGGLVACSFMANAQDAQGGRKGGGKGGKGGGGRTVEQRLEQMTTDLGLTDAQKPKVKAVLEESSKKMQEVMGSGDRTQAREKMQPIMEEQNKKLKEILTAEQLAKYQEQQKSRFSRQGGGKGGGKKKTDQ
jgi:Spy/CpxP family protein refolding chaperone